MPVRIVEGRPVLRFELVEVGNGDQESCARCGPASQPATYIPAAIIEERIRQAVGDFLPPGPNVMFGRVDAFGHPELPSLVGAAVTEGVVRIGLETDGGALAAGGNAAGALHAGVRHVRVTCADLPKAVAGIASWAAAARAAGVDAVATAVVVLCSHNTSRLAQDTALLAEAGAGAITLDARALHASRDVVAQLVAACDTGVVNGVWVEVLGAEELLPESHALHRAPGGEAL